MAGFVIIFFFLAVMLFILVAGSRVRHAVHPDHATCPRCGHGIADAEFDAPCPACALPAARRAQTRCPTCKYDLTGTLDAARCPECGMNYPAMHIKHVTRRRQTLPRVMQNLAAAAVTVAAFYIPLHAGLPFARSIWEALPATFGRPPGMRFLLIERDGDPNPAVIVASLCTAAAGFILIMGKRHRGRMLATAAVAWAGLAFGVMLAWLDRYHNHGLAGTWMLWSTLIPALAAGSLELVAALRRNRQERCCRPRPTAP